MMHFLNCAGSIGEGSNFENSMVTRSQPYWGFGKFYKGKVAEINKAILRGEKVAVWIRGTRASCKKKYGSERLLGVFVVNIIKERTFGPLIALDPTDKDLGWEEKKGTWKYIIDYSHYYDISSLDFGKSKSFGLTRFPQSSLCCLNTMASLKQNRTAVTTMLDAMLTSIPVMGCVKEFIGGPPVSPVTVPLPLGAASPPTVNLMD